MPVQILHIGWIQYLLIYFFYGFFFLAVLFWIFQWHINAYQQHALIPICARCRHGLKNICWTTARMQWAGLRLRENYTVFKIHFVEFVVSPRKLAPIIVIVFVLLATGGLKIMLFLFRKKNGSLSKNIRASFGFYMKIVIMHRIHPVWYMATIFWNDFEIDVADTWTKKNRTKR